MALIKASEIGEYVYCQRSWWLHHVQGLTPAGRERRAHGVVRHKQHGRAVWLSQFLAAVGLVLLLVGALLLLLH